MQKTYRLGYDYIDTASIKNDSDQFLRWINIEGSGMRNSPGIRPLKFINNILEKVPAYLILVTNDKSSGEKNPWDDIVDFTYGEILYWGDAKYHHIKKYNDFEGNTKLEIIYDLILENKLGLVPPILHFSKPETGIVRFNGLCTLEKLELTWFVDKYTSLPIKNYRCHLRILDCEEVEVNWLHDRAKAKDLIKMDNYAPKVWKDYKRGKISKLQVWKSKIRGTKDQLPREGTTEKKILDQLLSLSPSEFEAVIVSIFKQMKEVTHSITKTRATRDGGFDFFGHFTLPYPLSYDIRFLGEVKKYSRNIAVQPKHISRLVARLSRGQYGIFVTTSYYTKQAQEEVFEDGYPVKLISGIDLVIFLRELRLVQNDKLSETWLNSVIGEL
jgi:HJR/Mrr/RecB family endonuclease